ncbi:MAG: ribokinase [Clostridiales bacterium]|nr:ribokinase [Clostridiales bacterium]
MARILNFGSLNLDLVYRVDAFVQPGETKSSLSLETHCGGKGLNQSVAAARAGAEVWHAGMIGCDGDMLYDKLRENGVNLTLLERSTGVSGHAIIQVDNNGQNCILLFGGTNQALTEDYIDHALAAFGSEGLALVQNETNLVGTIIEKAHACGLLVAINAAPMDEKVFTYPLELVDWLIVNEIEGAAIAKCELEVDILPKLRKLYPKMNVLLTLGKRGAVCARGEEQAKSGIYPVKVVDTTAAGDTFLGYFLTEALDHKSLPDALALATAASSMCVGVMGAADSVPMRADVLAAIEQFTLGKPGEWGGWR